MDDLFAKLAGQAVTLVGKAALGMATKIAMDQVIKIVKGTNSVLANKVITLKNTLEPKLNILIPSIELVEVAISRGNRSLECILDMTDKLKFDVDQMTAKLRDLDLQKNAKTDKQLELVISLLDELIIRCDSIASYIHLSLSITNAKVGSQLPPGLSPSRLLQASTLITSVEHSIRYGPKKHLVVGKKMEFCMFSLFCASSRPKGKNDFTWKEEFSKCYGHIERVDIQDKYQYELILKEDFDDGRYHESTDKPISKNIKVIDVTKMYYTSSGKLLNIEDISSPVLVLKISSDKSNESKNEWIALALNTPGKNNNEKDGDSDDEEDTLDTQKLEESIDKLVVKDDQPEIIEVSKDEDEGLDQKLVPIPPLRESGKLSVSALSLFEFILRLSMVEVAEQKSHLLVPDEMLARYLQSDYQPPESP